MNRLSMAALILLAACSRKASKDSEPVVDPAPRGSIVVTIVGTNDLHGALDRLPILAGFVSNLRDARQADGGALILVDGGDMFQGTIESNANEGAAVIDAYNAIGYDAATIGNHEFDFGPAGPAATPHTEGDDPRGALRARMAQASFPLLSANVVDEASGALFGPATASITKQGVRVAVIGVTTESTPYTTMPANFVGLAMRPLAASIEREARRARDAGVEVVVVAAHAGSRCKQLSNPNDTTSCATGDEIFAVANALPRDLVDVIVAGHTHAPVAHYVNGIAIIESYSQGRAFGRVDVTVDLDAGEVTASRIHEPRDLCPGERRVPVDECEPGEYEGKPVKADPLVARIVSKAVVLAESVRGEPLGVNITAPIRRSRSEESALGNLFADLMLAARPEADVAITNGGGLRADLPAGPLTYGAFYESNPFDNRFSLVTMTGRHLRALVVDNLRADSGIFSFAGVRITARCAGGELEVELARPKGGVIADADPVVVVTSDFLSSGGDGAFGKLDLPDGAVKASGDDAVRDGMADVLRERGGTLSGDDPALYSARARRFAYPGERPVTCEK